MSEWTNRADMSDRATEDMANVISDLCSNRVQAVGRPPLDDEVIDLMKASTIIDIRGVYNHWMANGGGTYMYEDHHVCPPWEMALMVYANSVGNVMAVQLLAWDVEKDGPWSTQWQPDVDDHVIEWDRVRWVLSAAMFSGGRHSSGIKVPTTGPLVWWRIAVYPDGEMADLHWTLLARDMDVHDFDNALMTMLATLDLCNCVNVVVEHPVRPMARPMRRRLERTGVRFSEIHIRPISKSYRGKGPGVPLSEMPAHSVRGHFNEYGVNGKGLLFGKISGRFWIPPHVRGSKEQGEILQSYVAEG